MKPFWEKEYLNKNKSTFGNPSEEIEKIVKKLKPGACILDLGCGDGRNALFLAGKDFSVDAVDISVNGINKINDIKEQNNLPVNTIVCDVSDYQYTKQYDLIIAHGLLQFIEKEKQAQVINNIKSNTKKGGYNIIAVFTDEEPVPEDLKDIMVGIFKEEEIKDYYSDWKIKFFESKKFNDSHEGGIKHCHALNKIVVKKV